MTQAAHQKHNTRLSSIQTEDRDILCDFIWYKARINRTEIHHANPNPYWIWPIS